MKIICKVYPSENACCGCVDEQLRGDRVHMDCNECRKKIPEYEVLQFGHSLFFGDWAIVLCSDGTVEKVKMSRVKEVRTEYTEDCIFRNDIWEQKMLKVIQ